jgi:NADH-quinone oxidoreductase subunit L
MSLTFWTFHTLEFIPVFEHAVEMFHAQELVPIFGTQMELGSVLTAITALFLMGAAGKSAQIPLYIWLPDAMAGPTPVSALIHAATMVTSGIYLIVRSNVLFEIVRQSDALVLGIVSSPDLVAYVGAATALLAGLIAFTQFDIKKVLAYSTVSQLGFMIAAIGMGAYVAGMFHLVTHAFFKALLFLGSGSVIHGMEHGHHEISHGDHHDHFDPQDMRTMGGLKDKMPWTFRTYMVGALALAGIVPLAGFWSKDEILAHASSNGDLGISFTIVYWMLTAAAICTAFYMGRQLKMVFFGAPRHEAAKHAHESSPLMTTPLVILAVLAIVGGLLNFPNFGAGSAEASHEEAAAETEHEGEAEAEHAEAGGFNLAMEHWLEHSITSFELTEAGTVHMPHTPTSLQVPVAAISTVLAVLALGASFFWVYGKKPETADQPDPLQRTPIWWFSVLPLNTLVMGYIVPAFNRLAVWLAETVDWVFWHDFVHNNIIRDFFVGFARFASEILDANGVDGIVNGAGKVAKGLANIIRQSQTGFARNYALSVFLGAVALLAYFLLAN